MKNINIYALTRLNEKSNIQKLERQMSGRYRFLKIKEWEIDGLRKLVDNLLAVNTRINQMDFYYSYQIPKLGKEFDLLRIDDEKIVNIELKSDIVSDEKIKKQLVQNRYYLNTLGRTIRSYTYISKANRLVRLTNSERLIDVDFSVLHDDLSSQGQTRSGDIEEIFREEDYIFSPLAEPDRFLNKEYFLTSQQKDIAYHILKNISDKEAILQGFTGAPGTGKTLLLYDLAMSLSEKQYVAVFHCGSFPLELSRLDERLKRIDFFDGTSKGEFPDISKYSYILVDEGHRASYVMVKNICDYARRNATPVVVSYDCEDVISEDEIERAGIRYIEDFEGFVKYRLTNRIRTNAELSSFIHCLMHLEKRNHRRYYPSVNIYYAGSDDEEKVIIDSLCAEDYTYIYDGIVCDNSAISRYSDATRLNMVHIDQAVSGEYDKVVMILDSDFYYEDDYLRAKEAEDGRSLWRVANVFHGLSRSKQALAIIVKNNETLLGDILEIVQG